MPITQEQLSAKIKAAMNFHSDDPEVDIEAARQHLADEIAAGVAEFTVGRETTVVGVQTGGSTAVGTINPDT